MEVPHDKCPNNDEGSHIPITDEIGEVAYCLCGKVFDEENLSRMEERYFGPHDKLPDRRHHSPLTPDRQSNTVISKSANDAKGMEIPKDVREKFRKLQKWETMSKYSDGKKRNLKVAIPLMQKFLNKMFVNINSFIGEDILAIYNKALGKNLCKGRNIEVFVAGSIYAAFKRSSMQKDVKYISEITGVKKRDILKAYRILVENEITHLPEKVDYKNYVNKVVNEFGLSTKFGGEIIRYIEMLEEKRYTSGKHPAGIVGGVAYELLRVKGDRKITQDDLSEVLKITSASIRKRTKDIRELIGHMYEETNSRGVYRI